MPRVQLVARLEGASSLSVDALSHVASFPSVRDVRGQLETDEVDEKVAVLESRDAPRAACTERLAPCGEASAMYRYVSVLILPLEAPTPPLRRVEIPLESKLKFSAS